MLVQVVEKQRFVLLQEAVIQYGSVKHHKFPNNNELREKP